MKQYDLYVVMAPDADAESELETLTTALVNSGLKYTRHIGSKDDMAARRDIDRLLADSDAVLYVSDEATNRLPLSAETVKKADKAGLNIIVLRLDNSNYPADVAGILANSIVYDALAENQRPMVVSEMVGKLGGNAKSAPEVTPGTRPTTPDAQPTTGPETVADAEADETRPITRPQSTWTIVIEIILALVVIAGVIALAVK